MHPDMQAAKITNRTYIPRQIAPERRAEFINVGNNENDCDINAL